jgi:hypothetical protein
MAYREFHFEKIYAAPDISILTEGLNKAADNIGNMFRAISQAQQAKKKAVDQYKFDLGEGKFENDDKIFFQKSLNLTQRGKQEMREREYRRFSPQLEHDQNMSLMEKKESDWQFKKFKQNEEEISAREKEDPYFDPQPDREANKLAAYGEDGDIYYATRGERLEAYDKVKGKMPQSLRGKTYTANYIKAFGAKEKTRVSENPDAKSTTYDKTPFLTPQGTPGVTVDHAKEYLSSRADGSVARWIEYLVDQKMDEDVAYNKARNPDLKNISDDEVKLWLKANPKENKLNQKDFATRVIEKAQSELAESAAISKKTDYETKTDKSITGGLYKNDAIGHSYTDHVDNVGGPPGVAGNVADASGVNRNFMPGGNLRIGKGAKIGNAIPVDMNPKYMYNIRTGKSQENIGSTKVNLTGYQIQPYYKDGKPYTIAADSPEALIKEINRMPYEAFSKLNPEMDIALRGYTVEYGNKLGEIASRREELDDELAQAVKSGDVDKETQIKLRMENLRRLSERLNLSEGEFSEEDQLSALRQSGISVSNIKRDVLLKASQSDLDLINKNLTQGLNLQDRRKWSDPMRAAAAAYEKRAQEAAAAGYKGGGPSMTEFMEDVTKKKPAKKSSKVPEGKILVISPDGKKGYIPQEQLDDAIKAGYKKSD